MSKGKIIVISIAIAVAAIFGVAIAISAMSGQTAQIQVEEKEGRTIILNLDEKVEIKEQP